MFVQSFTEGKLEGDRIVLKPQSDKTVYFTDRPDRISGQLDTAKFVTYWDKGGPNSFTVDPPNAALSLADKKGEDIVDWRKPYETYRNC